MESNEELENMTLQELKKSKAYFNCSISKPGFPKSKMIKQDLLDLLKLDKKIKNKRQMQYYSGKPIEQSSGVTEQPSTSMLAYATQLRIEKRLLTKEEKEIIIERLEKFVNVYTLLDDPRMFAFSNALDSIKNSPVLTLLDCKSIKGIGPVIFKEIRLALRGEQSKKLNDLLENKKIQQIKKKLQP